MKRFSLILASLVLVFGAKASAFTGGPFGNGDYSELLDNSGIYQVSFRFSNGSGFAQFGNNVDADLFLGGTATGTAVVPSSFSVLNRSIIYYKGVTYLGTCTGMVDHDAKIVAGVTNGASDVTTSATTTSGGTSVSASNSLISNGNIGFPCNTEFRCKITKSYPILRFSGKGELTIVNPSLAQTTFAALQAIITGGGGGVGGIGTQIGDLVTAITGNQAALESLVPSAQAVRDVSDHVPMKVFGSRIFFQSRR